MLSNSLSNSAFISQLLFIELWLFHYQERTVVHIFELHIYLNAEHKYYDIRNLKENLEDGEIVNSFDFAENYAFVILNSAQSFHWNNNQATIFVSVQQKRATERARCLFRVKCALFNSLIIVCCVFEKKTKDLYR